MSCTMAETPTHCTVAEPMFVAPGAVDTTPCDAEQQHQLGVRHELNGELQDAIDRYRAALASSPSHAEAHANLGGLLRRQGELSLARVHLSEAIALDAQLYRAHHNRAQVDHDLGQLELAIAGYRRALALVPNAYETLVNLATVLSEAGQFADAVATFRQAIAAQPSRAEAYNNLGQCWQAQGRFDDALHAFDEALERAADDAEIHLNRAFLWLQGGDFSRGWREYEWRWHKHRATAPRLPQSPWHGQPLADKHILVYAEQGLGDEIMFLTCLPELAAEARACTVACDHRLARMVARSFPTVRVIGCRRGRENWGELTALAADFQTPAGALPRYLRPNTASFTPCDALLAPDASLRSAWRQRLGALGPGKKIGVAWRGGVKNAAEIRQRSVPVHLLAEWTQTPGLQFVVLQHDARPDELIALGLAGNNVHVFPELDLRNDLESTAAVLAELDLVISAAGAVVHLAGAVGAPTWLLLPQHWGWRWLKGRSDSVWYRSVEVIRQPAHGDWATLTAGVGRRLAGKFAVQPAPQTPFA